jgi:hypothetical protein
MYGGGFAAIPAYLADLFGTGFVGAIHGRLLTAWSVAGILGPVLVNYVNEQQIRAGVPRAAAYDRTMILLAGLLAVGFVCNSLVKPLTATGSEPTDAADKSAVKTAPAVEPEPFVGEPAAHVTGVVPLAAFWLLVAVPMAWGLWATIRQAAVLFG